MELDARSLQTTRTERLEVELDTWTHAKALSNERRHNE
jgi:hypothetical protein